MKASQTNAKAKSNGYSSNSTSGGVFGEQVNNLAALQFSSVAAEAVTAVITGVCRVGGYISFSSAPGGHSIKLNIGIGEVRDSRWCHSEQELSEAILLCKRAIDSVSAGGGR